MTLIVYLIIMYCKKTPFYIIKAFSLIEVIIVLAIIASLASASIPNYKSYIIKAKVIEGLSLLNQFKIDIYEYYFANLSLPNSGDKIFNGKNTYDLSDSNKFMEVKYIYNDKIAGLAIKVKNNLLNNKNYIYAWAKVNGEFIEWDCGSNGAEDSIPKSYYPKSCNY